MQQTAPTDPEAPTRSTAERFQMPARPVVHDFIEAVEPLTPDSIEPEPPVVETYEERQERWRAERIAREQDIGSWWDDD